MACRSRSLLLLLPILALALSLNLGPVLADTNPPEDEPVSGGLREANIQEKEVKEALDFAVIKHNEQTNDLFLRRVVEVQRAQKQVVAGMKYYFDVVLARTTCLKSQADLTNCPIIEQPNLQERERCSFVVYVVPWQNEKTLRSSTCNKA